jgi:hypothetical protein
VAASEDGRSTNTGMALQTQSERSMLELQRVEESSRPILEAQRIYAEIQREKEQYLTTIQRFKAESTDKMDYVKEFQEKHVKELKNLS